MNEVNQAYEQTVKNYTAARHGEAECLCRQILSEHPNHSEAFGLLGKALFSLGRTEEAIAALQRAAALRPDQPDLHNNLGVALNHAHRYAEAMEAFGKALALRPQEAEICNNMGICLQGLGRYAEAAEFHSRAAALRPAYREAYFHRGRARTAMEMYPQALEDYHRVVELSPDWADAYNGIGMVQVKRLAFDKALAAYGKAIELDSGFFHAYYNRANALVLLGRYEEAVADFTKAIERYPNFSDAYWNRGLAYLLMGDYARGWSDYAWRKHAKMHLPTYPHQLTRAEWHGEPFTGRRLLVHYEQGYGDSIQCWRFLPQVKALGGTVIVEERGPLLGLLEEQRWADLIIASNPNQPPQTEYDLHVSMLDLPRIFQATADTVGRTVPYVRAAENRKAKWACRIDPKYFSIGIAWAGSPLHGNDLNRSARLNYFLPLGRIAGVRLYSLQKGASVEELARAASVCGITDLGNEFADFGDTAGAMAHLDLVISVDTAVLHLAGAMGRRAWGVLPYAPDWRWMRNAPTAPWYPTVRLFRQTDWGDWNRVFLRVTEEVRQAAEGRAEKK
jgi:tetratricopeptide (TPR) repeat protein